MATLRLLAKKKGDFGSLTDELMRDRIVCGIHNDAVCAQLLREKDLTLESAIRICMLFERAERGTKELKREAFVCREKCLQCNSTKDAVTIAGVNMLLSATNARLLTNAATHATSGITLPSVVDLSLKIQVDG